MGRLFSDSPAGVVAVVEMPVSRHYAHRARLTFFTIAPLVTLLVALVLSAIMSPIAAALIGMLTGFIAGMAAALFVRAWPVLRTLWWWSAELIGLLLLVIVINGLSQLMPAFVAVITVAAVAATAVAAPRVRRPVWAWCWCGIDRHRLRHAFAQVIRSAHRTPFASLPLMLWARPTPAGERVYVWLRPGLDADGPGRQDRTSSRWRVGRHRCGWCRRRRRGRRWSASTSPAAIR